jgi:hypothetical protein
MPLHGLQYTTLLCPPQALDCSFVEYSLFGNRGLRCFSTGFPVCFPLWTLCSPR